MRPSPARWLVRRCASCRKKDRSQRWGRGEMRRGGERGSGWLEQRDVPPLGDTAPLLCSLTRCLLLIIILFLYLSLQKHALPAPAAWQPLVSRTQLLRRLSHSQPPLPSTSTSPLPTPSPTTPLSPQQHQDRCSSTSKHKQSHPFPLCWHFLKRAPTRMWREYRGSARGEKCCLTPLLAGKCCCKGIFGTAQHYPPSRTPWCVFNWCIWLWQIELAPLLVRAEETQDPRWGGTKHRVAANDHEWGNDFEGIKIKSRTATQCSSKVHLSWSLCRANSNERWSCRRSGAVTRISGQGMS